MTIKVTIPKENLDGLQRAVMRTVTRPSAYEESNIFLHHMLDVFYIAIQDNLVVTMNFEDYQEMKLLIEEYKWKQNS